MNMSEDYKEWTELEHPIWGKGGREEDVHDIIEDKYTFPTKIWRKGRFSIIPPCSVTMGQWEIYDGKDVERFPTLEEAQNFADNPPLQ